MKIRRFFAHSSQWHNNTVELDAQESHHAIDVLRLAPGNEVQCFDERGRQCSGTIISINMHSVSIRLNEQATQHMQSYKITLAQVLVKAQQMDFIVKKSVELGVTAIIPFLSDHCVVQIDEKRRSGKHARREAIIKDAAKQCGRSTLPILHPCISFDKLLTVIPQYDLVLLADPYAERTRLTDHLQPGCSVLVLIGPEGGFSDSETERIKRYEQCLSWSFNDNILRAETAALSALAIVSYEYRYTYE